MYRRGRPFVPRYGAQARLLGMRRFFNSPLKGGSGLLSRQTTRTLEGGSGMTRLASFFPQSRMRPLHTAPLSRNIPPFTGRGVLSRNAPPRASPHFPAFAALPETPHSAIVRAAPENEFPASCGLESAEVSHGIRERGESEGGESRRVGAVEKVLARSIAFTPCQGWFRAEGGNANHRMVHGSGQAPAPLRGPRAPPDEGGPRRTAKPSRRPPAPREPPCRPLPERAFSTPPRLRAGGLDEGGGALGRKDDEENENNPIIRKYR